MVIAYIIILLLSTSLTSWAALRVSHRLGTLFNKPDMVPAGLFAAVAIIAFLTVVAAPAKLLVGAILLIGLGLASGQSFLPPVARWGVPFIVVMLGVSTLTFPVIGHIPPLAVMAGAALGWLALTLGSTYAPDDAKIGSIGFIMALLPLVAASFAFHASSHIALDAGLMIAGLVGLTAAYCSGDLLGLGRAPLTLLLGWLMLSAATQGAWIPALVSLLAWGGAIAYATQQNQPTGSDAFRI